jgi:hypothetical protein
MRSATILDVLHAVTRVARGHQDVDAWWYAPPQRLRVAGDVPAVDEQRTIEVAIDVAGPTVDEEMLARELRDLLSVPDVRVRRRRESGEPRTLFRLVTTRRGE